MPARDRREGAANRWRLSVVVEDGSACLFQWITLALTEPFITMPDDNPHWRSGAMVKDAFDAHPDGGLHARFQLHFLEHMFHDFDRTFRYQTPGNHLGPAILRDELPEYRARGELRYRDRWWRLARRLAASTGVASYAISPAAACCNALSKSSGSMSFNRPSRRALAP